jgi:hypothetical protein
MGNKARRGGRNGARADDDTEKGEVKENLLASAAEAK